MKAAGPGCTIYVVPDKKGGVYLKFPKLTKAESAQLNQKQAERVM